LVYHLLPLLSGQHLVCLDVLGTSLVNDLSGHLNTLNTLDTGLGQPVAQELLVVAVLATTDLVGGLQPEAGGVYKILARVLTAFKGMLRTRCKHLIDEDNLPLLVQSELELGVGNDNSLLLGVLSSLGVELDGKLLDAVSVVLSTNNGGNLVGVDVLV
jgi:hypothetical protein